MMLLEFSPKNVCALVMPILALNCLLQTEQVSSENGDSDDDHLALALCSLCFLSASQIFFAS